MQKNYINTRYVLYIHEIKKVISFTIASKRKKKYLKINLTKEVKDLHTENCKSSPKTNFT